MTDLQKYALENNFLVLVGTVVLCIIVGGWGLFALLLWSSYEVKPKEPETPETKDKDKPHA